MSGIKAALDLISPGCFMGSIDLVSAYFSIPIHEEHKKLLKFYWGNQLYQFSVMPNGYCQAPFLFTLLLKPVYAKLHEMEFVSTYHLVIVYC